MCVGGVGRVGWGGGGGGPLSLQEVTAIESAINHNANAAQITRDNVRREYEGQRRTVAPLCVLHACVRVFVREGGGSIPVWLGAVMTTVEGNVIPRISTALA